MTPPNPIGWPEMLLIDLLNRLPSRPGPTSSEWFDDAWPEPYIEFVELGLVEGIVYEEYDDGRFELGLEGELRLTDIGQRVAEAARQRSACQAIGVFVSSGEDDSASVNEICAILANAGVRTWRHIQQLSDDWKSVLNHAIEGGVGVIACFSSQSQEARCSHMHEELMLAAEQLRLRPGDDKWFISVLLDEIKPPDIAIGPGRTLRDLPSILWCQDRAFARNALLRAVARL